MTSFRLSNLYEIVESSTPTQDGNWMILTRRTNKVASSPVELPSGSKIRIRDGVAHRVMK